MGLEWRLTGRAEELRFIDASIRRSTGARGLVLAGAAGVGKTRLAREALRRAAGRGMATRWAAATVSARSLPLGAFAALLGGVSGDPAGLLRRATDVLLTDSKHSGVVVGVDDAHLLDETSAMLVHQLLLRSAALIVITIRSGEPTPDAVTALWKDGELPRLELQSLSEPDVASLLESVLDGPMDSNSASRLWRLSGGNALFLRHLVDGELEAGRLARVNGVWRWASHPSWRHPSVSAMLADLVDTRMGRLSGSVREVVDILALGEPLGVSLLRDLTEPAAVEEAEERGLVSVDRDRRRLQARLSHPLYGEIRRARMGELRARRLRGSIATALAATGARRGDDTLRRAVLALDSDLPPDPVLLTAAAQSAIALADLALAERLARAAVAAGGGFSPRLTLAYALSWLNRSQEADIELSALAELARTDDERALVAISRAANLFFGLRRPSDAEAVIDHAEATVTERAAVRVCAAMRAGFHAWLGRAHEAVQSAREALSSAQLSGDTSAYATWGLVGGLGVLGRADEANRAAIHGYEIAARVPNGAVMCLFLSVQHVVGLHLAGYLPDAVAVTADRHQASVDALGPTLPMATGMVGRAALGAGKLSTAIRRLTEARASLTQGDLGGWDILCLMSLTQAQAMSGDADAATRSLAELEAQRHPAFVVFGPEILLTRAWVAAAEGAISRAMTYAREAAELAAGRGHLGYEVLALQTAVAFGDITVAGRLGELAALVDGPRAPAAAAHAAALAADDGDALLAVSASCEEMGDLLAAADAAAQAAVAYTRQGRPGTAQSAAVRAQRLARRCDVARTPALRAVARPLPLTPREREIVTLAANGMTNQQIADRLVVSVRTVEGHLYRAGSKLGTARRTDFAALLHDD